MAPPMPPLRCVVSTVLTLVPVCRWTCCMSVPCACLAQAEARMPYGADKHCLRCALQEIARDVDPKLRVVSITFASLTIRT